MATKAALGISAYHALAVYVESLAARARVAVFGDSTLSLGPRFLTLGARGVWVWDPDQARAHAESSRAPSGVVVRPYRSSEGSPRTVELAVVPDLGLFEDASRLISDLRALVHEDGAAVISAVNRDVAARRDPPAADREASALAGSSFEYYALYELVAREFEYVTMIAQMPFQGVSFVTLGEDGDAGAAVSVDAQLAGDSREIERYVVLASQHPISLDSYAVIELAAATSDGEADRVQGPTSGGEADRVQATGGDADRVQGATSGGEADRVQGAIQLSSSNLPPPEPDTVPPADDRIEAVRAESAAEVESVRRRAEDAESRALGLQTELAKVLDAHAAEVGRFEEALRERAQNGRSLEVELARREQIVRELVMEAEERQKVASARPDGSGRSGESELLEENAALRQRLDRVALELARREGDRQASEWKLAELQREMAQLSKGLPPTPAARTPE